jgi:hypothetical protein
VTQRVAGNEVFFSVSGKSLIRMDNRWPQNARLGSASQAKNAGASSWLIKPRLAPAEE